MSIWEDSGQISMIQFLNLNFSGILGDSLTKPQFEVTSAEVAIIGLGRYGPGVNR